MKRTAVGVGVLVALAVLLSMGMGGVVAETQPTNETTENNSTFGATVSSFMQASSAEAEGEVDDGMFEASLNRAETAEERRALVEQRQERLQQRQQRLENRRARLAENGSDVRSRAVAVHVTTGASELEDSVNDTETVAKSVGADTAALDELRTAARNLSGGEVAELARGVGLGPGMGGPGGPPANVGGEKNGTETGPNVSVGVPGAGGDGPPVNEGNGTDGGVNVGPDSDAEGAPASDDGDDGDDSDSDHRGPNSNSGAGNSGNSDAPGNSGTNGDADETDTDDG